MSKIFEYHVVIGNENICNYRKEKSELLKQILNGQRLVVYGRRNTGKTSLIKSFLIPEFRNKRQKFLCIYCDFMGCTTISQVANRIQEGFVTGYRESFPIKQKFIEKLDLIKSLKPSMTIDAVTGGLGLGIDVGQPGSHSLSLIFSTIKSIHKKTGVLLAFDEFQDLKNVAEGEALLRGQMQELPGDLPVVVLGSKKHMLSAMFANPDSPFAGWGVPLDIPQISAEDFQAYINERFEQSKLVIENPETVTLLKNVDYVPESVNMLCQRIADKFGDSAAQTTKSVSIEMIQLAFDSLLKKFKSHYTEYLSRFKDSEKHCLKALALFQPVMQVRSKDFLIHVPLSASGVAKIVKKFNDEAVILMTDKGFVLSDPLLKAYLIRFPF